MLFGGRNMTSCMTAVVSKGNCEDSFGASVVEQESQGGGESAPEGLAILNTTGEQGCIETEGLLAAKNEKECEHQRRNQFYHGEKREF